MAKVTISKDGKKQVSETQCFRQTGYVMYKYPICFLFQLTLINSYLYFFLLSWRRAHPGLEIRKVCHLLLPIHVYLELAYVTSMFVGWLPGWIGELLCCFHCLWPWRLPFFGIECLPKSDHTCTMSSGWKVGLVHAMISPLNASSIIQ